MFVAVFNTAAASILLLLTFGILYCAYVWLMRRRITLPVPDYNNFLLGHATELQKFDMDTLMKWAQQCGLVFKIYVFHYVTIVSSDHRWIREFCNNPKYPKPKVYEKIVGNLLGVRVMGYGLVTITDHSAWLKHRMMLNPAFTKQAIASLVPLFNDCADELFQRLRLAVDKRDALDIYAELSRAAMNAIAKSAFGMQSPSADAATKDLDLSHCISTYLRGEASQRNDSLLLLKPSKRKFVKEVRHCCQQLRAIGDRCINERFKLLLSDAKVPEDALTFLLRGSLEASPNGQLRPADVEWIVDEFVTLFVAGHETVSIVMAVVLYELARNPEVYARLLDELDTVIGKRVTSESTADSKPLALNSEKLADLRYLEQVIKEALRLYPPGVGTVRTVAEPLEIFDLKIPKGTMVLLNFVVAHRWPDYFDRPDEFIPERFDPDRDEKRISGTYTPFSLGPRFCIGRDFAMVEAKLLLARLLHEFAYEVLPEPKFELEMVTTLRPKHGLVCKLQKRQPVAASSI